MMMRMMMMMMIITIIIIIMYIITYDTRKQELIEIQIIQHMLRSLSLSLSLYIYIYTQVYRGFYFVCVIICHSDIFFAKRYDFGCNFSFAPKKQSHPKFYRLAFLCLPWSHTK